MNKIEEVMHKAIFDHLVGTGCNKYAAKKAADKGIEHFRKCNLKDPYFECVCHAGLVWAESLDKSYKFKKPSKVKMGGFKESKPKPRKHNKQQESMF